MSDKNKPKQSVEAAFTARLMRNNFMLMGPRLFAALPPWVHALEWEKGTPDLDDLDACGAIIGAVVENPMSPQDARMEFHVCNSSDDKAREKFVMWAPLQIRAFKGQMPLWLQFKTP